MDPSSVEERDLSEPPNAPKGVRLAATMKMFVIIEIDCNVLYDIYEPMGETTNALKVLVADLCR